MTKPEAINALLDDLAKPLVVDVQHKDMKLENEKGVALLRVKYSKKKF